MLPLLKRLVLPLLAVLLTASPAAAQAPNPNVRFGLPSPAKAENTTLGGVPPWKG